MYAATAAPLPEATPLTSSQPKVSTKSHQQLCGRVFLSCIVVFRSDFLMWF
jgi:hypothetical protein